MESVDVRGKDDSCATSLPSTADYDAVNCTLFGSYNSDRSCWPKSGNIDGLAFTRQAARCYSVGDDGTLTLESDATKCSGSKDALTVYQLDSADFTSTDPIPASNVSGKCADATSADASCVFADQIPAGQSPSVGGSTDLACKTCDYCVTYAYGVSAWTGAAPSGQ